MSPTPARGALLCLGLVLGGGLACEVGDAAAPTIVAQGFELDQGRSGPAGDFPAVRLRVEAPAGIESLRIRERSYEVDLARSPEPSHFPLFGLSKRVWSKRDVTIDFAPYVGEKIEAPGRYPVEITVVDRNARSTSAALVLEVLGPAASSKETQEEAVGMERESRTRSRESVLRTRSFRFERVGAGEVQGAAGYGIEWATVEPVSVVIRIVGREGPTTRFARLEPSSFAAVDTRDQMASLVEGAELSDRIEIATAADRGAGAVFAVTGPEGSFLLHTDESATSLSALGTTVTLAGRCKY